MSDRIYPDEHLPVMASSNNPPAGTPNAVEEARSECARALGELMPRYFAQLSPVDVEGWRQYDEALDAVLAAVRTQAFADVRRVVEGIAGLTATVSAYSSWSETDERPVHHPELEGVCFIRRSDVLKALDTISEGK